MQQHGISREQIAAVLRSPEVTNRDEWVEHFLARIDGRDMGVIVSRRLEGFVLVVTVFPVDDE